MSGRPALPVPHLPEIITRYANGESLRDLGKDLNVSRQTVYKWLLAGLGQEEHQQLVTECLVNRIADADGELDDAKSLTDIARAREKMRYSRMDFERRRPNLYGAKQEIKHTGSVPQLNISVAVAAPQTAPSVGNVINNSTQEVENKW